MTDTTYQYLIPSGVIVADTQDTLAEVQQEWKGAFGADLVVDASTPQGVMITAEAIARNNVIKNNAALANQINPNVAGKTFLDGIGALTGITRNVQQPTVVLGVALTGVAGTVIPSGAQAKTDPAGDLFELQDAVTLAADGTGTGTFQSVDFGPIPCPIGELTAIVSGILGWETITNANAGILGSTTQSDQAFRAFRLNTLGFQGLSLAAAITSAIYAVPGVFSLSFRENFNDVPQGMIVTVAGGETLGGTIWGMTTETGSGPADSIICGTDPVNFAETDQTLPAINPWPTADFTTTGNIALSGLATRGGGDWGSTLTAGQHVLVKDQSSAAQNGVYIAEAGAWVRETYNAIDAVILGANSGLSLTKNSVYACVEGGTSLDVAAALLENKSSGAGWNGGTSQSVIEPASGQAYSVLFDRPATISIVIKVYVTGATPDQVNKAILDYKAGTVTDPAGNPSNLSGFTVGQDVSPFELAAAIAIENPGCYVSNLEIAVLEMSPSYATTPIPIGLNQIGYTQASYIVTNVV